VADRPRPTVLQAAPSTANLALVRRDTRARTLLGAGPLSIGRSNDRDLTIDDDRVSRKHAHLERRGAEWYLVDDGSANGTTINRSKLPAGESRPVKAGDRIGIGPFDLDVVTDGDVEREDRTQVFRS
jgi:pSer/pThr/pTyr-binding forkhead associated (FHA) protein